ncbi:methylmalonyl-CoA mutase family protein [Chishuiella sp.]|uniref:methylmalonyl-CoA mutase family protein n=1 Tax=Chishuiella sp. TaxID=1969467 RepID=UPI0028A5C98F|nr:methylmalonyl-CoA mutase family protein [Chishuiella sp.]
MNQKTDFSNLKFKRINHLDDENSFDTNNNSIEKQNDYLNATSLEQANSFPGFFPFLRGYSTTGYILKPWNINQNNCFSNEKKNYNFDDKSFSSTNQMSSWLKDNLSDDISITISTNKKGIIYFAYLLIAIETLESQIDKLTINLVVTTDNFEDAKILLDYIFCSNLHKSNSYNLSIINKTLDDNLLDSIIYPLIRNYQLIERAIKKEVKIDTVIPLLSLSLPINKNSIQEICKLRAIRMIWAKLIEDFKPQNIDCYKIKIHSFLKNENIENTHQQIFNTTNQALSAVLGGTESLCTQLEINKNFPLRNNERIAENLQLILQDEIQIHRTVDPFGGSFMIESITNEIAIKAYQKIKEICSTYSSIETFTKQNINANTLELVINEVRDNADFNKIFSILESTAKQ